jgi:hypothetical protein
MKQSNQELVSVTQMKVEAKRRLLEEREVITVLFFLECDSEEWLRCGWVYI